MASLEVPWKTKTLSELFSIEHESISPAAFPSELFEHYSIPAWDRLGAAVLEPGSSIGSTKSLITKRTILVSKLNPRKPRVVLVDGSPRGRTCASTEFIPYVPRSEEADLRFYRRFFESGGFQRRLEQIATGTTNSHVRARPSETLTWDVPLPPHAEQGFVANILDTLDQEIQLTEQLIAKLQQMNQGLLHDLLAWGIDKNGELRDAVRHPEQFHASPLGLSPKSWDVQRVGDICLLGRGRVISQEYLVAHAGPYPVYSSQSREAGVFGWIDTYDFEGPHVTWTTDGAYAGTVFFRDGRFNCTNVCGTLSRRTDRLDLEYLALALQPRTQRHVSYVGNPKLMNNIMATIPMPLPPTLEQTAIAEIARVASDHVLDEIRSAVKLRRIRNGLMEDLLSGRVRMTALLDSNVA